MKPLYETRIVDRQVGRNAQLFAQEIARLSDPQERHPKLRALVSLIENAHPEWNQGPDRERQIAELAHTMSGSKLDIEEVILAVRARESK